MACFDPRGIGTPVAARWQRELYYYDGVTGNHHGRGQREDRWHVVRSRIPKALFQVPTDPAGRNHFVVSKDGQRFLVVTQLDDLSASPLQVMVNWR